jgi:acetyl-CoA/propionyl-CoA carboxylase biotin carboxyl carrier protein
MRLVREAAALPEAIAAARREARRAFGDDTLLVERYFDAPRHIEVQIFGDTHGRVVHLGERECSIQRRHQKIIEEAPSMAVDAGLRADLGAAAVLWRVGPGAGRRVLLDARQLLPRDQRCRSARHRAITGLDLVGRSGRRGEALPFARRPAPGTPRGAPVRRGPAGDFLPATADRLWGPPLPGRYDSGVEGTEVSVTTIRCWPRSSRTAPRATKPDSVCATRCAASASPA